MIILIANINPKIINQDMRKINATEIHDRLIPYSPKPNRQHEPKICHPKNPTHL